MLDSKTVRTKRCFIVTPIGADDSPVRRKMENAIEIGLTPILEGLGYEVIVPHRISQPGSIPTQIIRHLLNDELVVAFLTGSPNPNPNVMYELAVRHSTWRPAICLASDDTKIPFDIADQRVLRYPTDRPFGSSRLYVRLKDAIRAAELDPEPDNPIFREVRECSPGRRPPSLLRIEKPDQPVVNRDFLVSGRYEYIAAGSTLRLFVLDGGRYWPQREITVIEAEQTWQGHVNFIGGVSGDVRSVLVMAMGADGVALCRYFDQVGKERGWEGIEQLTTDIVECARVEVVLR